MALSATRPDQTPQSGRPTLSGISSLPSALLSRRRPINPGVRCREPYRQSALLRIVLIGGAAGARGASGASRAHCKAIHYRIQVETLLPYFGFGSQWDALDRQQT